MVRSVFLLSVDDMEKCEQADNHNQGDQEEGDYGDDGRVHASARYNGWFKQLVWK